MSGEAGGSDYGGFPVLRPKQRIPTGYVRFAVLHGRPSSMQSTNCRLLLCAAVAMLAGVHAGKRIKVQHLSPFVGRHDGGLLVNVTGRGV